MPKKIDKLKKRIEELEIDAYKLEQKLIVMVNTCNDRFDKLLGVQNGKGRMTSFDNYMIISLSEQLGVHDEI